MSSNTDDSPPQRRHPAHGILYVEGQPTILFDTVCTKDRKPWLATDEVYRLLCDVWADASEWLVGRFMQRKKAYACDVTYGTAQEIRFDFSTSATQLTRGQGRHSAARCTSGFECALRKIIGRTIIGPVGVSC